MRPIQYLLPLPTIHKRRSKELQPDFVPVRSSRLAKRHGRSVTEAMRQVRVSLIKHLSLNEDREVLGDFELDKHGQLFTKFTLLFSRLCLDGMLLTMARLPGTWRGLW